MFQVRRGDADSERECVSKSCGSEHWCQLKLLDSLTVGFLTRLELKFKANS
ncbi:hypothetical protein [Nostoc sp. CHAB 5715]|uniref:hypothetical protein n=1 Tax=Nostoc sp. CHAB 5715 TaxID=2780400 RepID=UPI001E647150|nr:hypothetical protein [Nostoc sp. CHAB 5715]MCC5622034.1 hypothetical protein [Nostoc sp. CHAB 5715]